MKDSLTYFFTLGFLVLCAMPIRAQNANYPWLQSSSTTSTSAKTVETFFDPPAGFRRVSVSPGSFQAWLRGLPMRSAGTKVRLYDGSLKLNQSMAAGVVDLDLIGKNLQQCIDVMIRLRAEYLRSVGREDEIAFSFTCCREKISWEKWKAGWRTKIVKRNGRDAFEWVKSKGVDASYANFKAYLYRIMVYAGTYSLARDMEKVEMGKLNIGDGFVEGGPPGRGHGLIILDMVENEKGEKRMLLAQSWNPAQDLHILRNPNSLDGSPWFPVNFGQLLETPQWHFSPEHARRFE